MTNSSYEQKKAILIEEITAAFDGVSREDGITLHEAMALDNYGGPEERRVARAQDTEVKWQDVSHEDIRSSDAVLHFLDPKGFQYYIPAFLVWYLIYMDSDDPDFWSDNFDSVDYQLDAGGTGDIKDIYLSKFKFLTLEQSKAVAHFLDLMAEKEDLYLAEEEALRQAEIARGDISREKSDAHLENVKRNRAYHGISENHARHSLNRYWGQFL
ncbi:MAG: DUF6714 family protein [Abditibacteriaceae bacterium]